MSVTAPARAAATPDTPLLGSAARHGVVNLVSVVWQGVLSFVLVVVLTKGLGKEGFGAFSAAMALFTILMGAGRLGADTGLLRFIPRLRAQGRESEVGPLLRTALVPVIVLGLATGILTWVFAPELADWFVKGDRGLAEASAAIRAMAPVLPLAAASTVALVGTRGFGSSIFSAVVQNMVVPTLRPILALGAMALVAGSVARSSAVAFTWSVPLVLAFLAALLYLVRSTRRLQARPPSSAAPADAGGNATDDVSQEFWRFTRARGFATTIESVTAWASVLFVSGLRGAGDAGVYNAVMRYVVLGTFALQAVRVAIGPQISMLVAQRRRADAQLLFQTMTTWLVALSWPYYLMLAVFSHTLLSVFGGDFTAGTAAMLVLCCSELVDMATGNVTLVLLMSGHSGWNLFNVLSSVTTSVTLSLLLIPPLGVTGAAIAWGSAVIVENVAATLEVWFLLGIRSFSKPHATVGAGAVVVFGGLLLAGRELLGRSLTAMFTSLLVAGVVYLGFLFLARRQLHLDTAMNALRQRQNRGRRLKGETV